MKYKINTDQKALFNKFFPVFVLLATIILGAIFWSYFMFEVDNDIKDGEMRHQSILQIQSKEITSSIEDLFIDLQEISARDKIKDYVAEQNRENRDEVIASLSRYMKRKRYYNRIVLLTPYTKKSLVIESINDSIQNTFHQELDLNINDRINKINKIVKYKYKISKIRLLKTPDKLDDIDHYAISISSTIETPNGDIAILSLSCSLKEIVAKMKNDKQILLNNRRVSGKTFLVDTQGKLSFNVDSTAIPTTPNNKYCCSFLSNYNKQADRFAGQQSGSFVSEIGFFNYNTINFGHILEELLIENKVEYNKENIPQNIEYKLISYIPEANYSDYNTHKLSRLIVTYLIILFLLIIISYLSATALSNKIFNQILLKRSAKKLHDANTTKGKFINILAHDLKNPIMTIQGFSTILQNDDPCFTKEQKSNYARLILQSSKGMLQLIEDVLAWSKSQSGELTIHKSRIDVAKQINSSLELIELQAIKKEITIIKEFDNDIMIDVDNNMFLAIIRNLVSNAIKFSHRGKFIKIKTDIHDNHCRIMIKDNGVGISQKNLNKLFDVGEKHYTKGTENEKGTGLGLVLCKEFINKNSGTINIKSQVERGTTITILFPL
ncbi:HAMP domain-containing histidine kinase [Halosquirtibacter xylanolyticus]|uniref:sensor histidine kinase n=1 Tax=Halosquirtibacter xylanolyticus TaxID=3374599 RepID=UPI0037497A83|nr:HAMP domain-containing histidine kinase [Prolixibacteraceae bacterium]